MTDEDDSLDTKQHVTFSDSVMGHQWVRANEGESWDHQSVHVRIFYCFGILSFSNMQTLYGKCDFKRFDGQTSHNVRRYDYKPWKEDDS